MAPQTDSAATAVNVTQIAAESSTTTDGHDPSVDSLADDLGSLSTKNVTQCPARAVPQVTSEPEVVTVVHRPKKAKYYSVTVGKCCGVYSSW
jgi:hypothetical protein